jgi:hypothetical protein
MKIPLKSRNNSDHTARANSTEEEHGPVDNKGERGKNPLWVVALSVVR